MEGGQRLALVIDLWSSVQVKDDFLSLIGHSVHALNWFQFSVLFCYCFNFRFTWPLPEEDGDLSCHNNESVGSLASYPSQAIITVRSHKPWVISLAPVVSSLWSERPAAHLHGFSSVCRSPTAAPQVFVWLSVTFHYRFMAWVSRVIYVVCHSPSLTLTCLSRHTARTYRDTLMHVT